MLASQIFFQMYYFTNIFLKKVKISKYNLMLASNCLSQNSPPSFLDK
jgi:hypothetical protein